MDLKKSALTFLTSLYLLSPIKAQDTLKFSANHWLLPHCKIEYYQSPDSNSINLKLNESLNIFYSQTPTENGVRILETMEDTSVYDWNKETQNISWVRKNGESKNIPNNPSVNSLIDVIEKALSNNLEQGTYQILVDESFKDIYVKKEETDSTVTLTTPLDYDNLPIKEIKVEFYKKNNKLEPKEIFIDFPWYLTFLDYKLKREK
ncbi:hypothetical protein H8D83_00150 [Candidatus Woesearchaeota archaeon]|nr:hypothetical protein [Candidatus Woesearchaeota archaeon]MBL7051162.1 hypothetical protein [Candidatus Woesearchaeota archaeon]